MKIGDSCTEIQTNKVSFIINLTAKYVYLANGSTVSKGRFGTAYRITEGVIVDTTVPGEGENTRLVADIAVGLVTYGKFATKSFEEALPSARLIASKLQESYEKYIK